MNRQLKFRATLKGKIVAYIRITPDEDGRLHTLWNTDNTGGWILTEPPKHDKLDEFTGLLDKNGKEIYEGDVVYADIHRGIGYEKKKGIIEYQDKIGAFVFRVGNVLEICGVMKMAENGKRTFEVIGNIMENPELLERKS